MIEEASRAEQSRAEAGNSSKADAHAHRSAPPRTRLARLRIFN